jgi:hypothetical protein
MCDFLTDGFAPDCSEKRARGNGRWCLMEERGAHFGKVAVAILGIAAVVFVLSWTLRPVYGDPLATFERWLLLCLFPAALVSGIAGIVCDRSKLLAIITTILAAALVLLNLETYLRHLS